MTTAVIDAAVVDHEDRALAVVEPVSDALEIRREPADVLAQATKAAKALMAVMAHKPHKVMMNGQQYIENDDWQTVGHFYGVTAKVESDQFVTFGDVQGWEARAVALTRDGREIGRATAMCLNDEDKWSTRPKYAYAYCLGDHDDHSKHEHSVEDPGSGRIVWEPNPAKPGKNRPRKFKVQTGEERVPMFQLRSMAQTRASSKVLRMVLGFVPVLAGFGATPAEELPNAEFVPVDASAAPVSPATSPAGRQPSVPNGGDSGVIDTTTGEERDSPPPGYHYVTNYQFKNGWHEAQLLNWDSQGGALRVSTKLNVGHALEQAAHDGVPVKCDITMKRGSKGEAYVNKVERYAPEPDDSIHAEPLSDDDPLPF